MLEKQYLRNNSPQFRLHLFSSVQREEQFINRRQKMLLLLMGTGGLWGLQYMLFQWFRRQETLGAGKKNSQWERLLRKKASFEFHRGFEHHGCGALLFVLQTFIVSTAVSWWRRGISTRQGCSLTIGSASTQCHTPTPKLTHHASPYSLP